MGEPIHAKASVVPLLLLFALVGCGAEPVESPPQEPVAPQSEAPEPTESEAPCIVGRWSLDVEDYVGQAAVFLKSIGIPLQSLTASGAQLLDIDAGTDAVLSVHTSLTWDAVLAGYAVTVDSASTGHGDWGFGESTSTIEVENWFWEAEPAVPAGDAPSIPLIDPGRGFEAVCSGDSLTVHGPDAPLIGHFTRAG